MNGPAHLIRLARQAEPRLHDKDFAEAMQRLDQTDARYRPAQETPPRAVMGRPRGGVERYSWNRRQYAPDVSLYCNGYLRSDCQR